jgi:NAD(P)-dependent dehydrogenase (short-subunit alcohol dehydrogenase family)
MAQKAKIALVTGANKGIGFEVSKQLAAKGYTVLMGARDAARGNEAAKKIGGTAQFLTLDLNDPTTITAAAKHIEEHFGVLDVLVNNAGILSWSDGPPSKTTLEAVRTIFDTNFFGTLAVTQAMLPLVRKSTAPRIVNVSSGLGSLALNSDPASPYAEIKPLGYNSSKAALNMLTIQLAWELRDTNAKVNASDPGYTATDLNNNSGPQTIEEGSEATVHLATLDENGPTGGYFDRHGVVPW